MPIDITKVVEIEPLLDKEYEPLLKNLQGNILKGHGRDYSIHLLIKFKAEPAQVKLWLGEFSKTYVTSALTQAQEAKRYRESRGLVQGTIFANVFLTISGYDYLGFVGEEIPFLDIFFAGGMKDPNTQIGFNDPPIEQWEAGFQQTIHALLLLADDSLENLLQIVQKETAQIENIAEVIQQDEGFVLRNNADKVIEHFGFRDGVSQPLFYKSDIEKERRFQPANFANWDPRAPLSLVLLPDPLSEVPESYGSYLVYRKLEQDVKQWNADVVALTKTLQDAQRDKSADAIVDENLVGAYLVGRFQDGTPIVLSKDQLGGPEAAINNFNFQEDTTGSKCPFHAHIRKTNPRGDTGNLLPAQVPLEEERMHRIVRRGISYGESDLTQEPEMGSGLLFMCFQSDINNQFAFMQKSWANSPGFIQQGTGSDPVIGPVVPLTETYDWPVSWGSPNRVKGDFSHWVSFKGGEYFFAPSVSFLLSLNPEAGQSDGTAQ